MDDKKWQNQQNMQDETLLIHSLHHADVQIFFQLYTQSIILAQSLDRLAKKFETTIIKIHCRHNIWKGDLCHSCQYRCSYHITIVVPSIMSKITETGGISLIIGQHSTDCIRNTDHVMPDITTKAIRVCQRTHAASYTYKE